jgi:hypothetical protein
VWRCLAVFDDDGGVFQTLLEKDILPSSKALDECYKIDNTNTWYCLAYSEKRIPVFQTLLVKGILPSPKALDECSKIDNANTWRCLAACKSHIPIFEFLLKKGIVPSREAVLIHDKYFSKNTLQSLEKIKNEAAEKIIKFLTSIHHFNALNIKNPHENKVSILLSRDDQLDFYGYLYLFYLSTGKRNQQIVPLDILYLMGKYCLPSFMSDHIFTLNSNVHRATFLKFHVNEAMQEYLKSGTFFSNTPLCQRQ